MTSYRNFFAIVVSLAGACSCLGAARLQNPEATQYRTNYTDRWITNLIELQVPRAETLLVLFHKPGFEPGPIPSVVFVADNVKSTYEELKARGVEFTQTPKKEPWGEHAILKDSEGNLVVFGTA
jgi:hypothetical protein